MAPDRVRSQEEAGDLNTHQRRSDGCRAAPAYLAAFSFSLAITVTALSGVERAIAEPFAAAERQARNVFQLPTYTDLQQRLTLDVLMLFRDQRYRDAEEALRELIRKFPDWPVHHYNLAAALARQNKAEEALDSLNVAVQKGFANEVAMARDPDLDNLRELPVFKSLLETVSQRSKTTAQGARGQFAPKIVTDGRAIIDETNTVWEPRSNTLISAFTFPDAPSNSRVRGGDDRISRRLNLWYGKGEAAGNHGDLYDNRDNGHSSLAIDLHPQLSHLEYGTEAVAAGVHYGVNAHLLFNAITIGNSSTALTGSALWRSQPRLIQTTPALMARAYQQYLNNHLYIFPEHVDHDQENGDLFPANTPYMLVSQGSSGSDQPILSAAAAILAAFNPSVKTFLREKHLVMPTVQMIFRASLKSLESPQDYLTAKAHPSVFDSDDINLGEMIVRAHGLRADEIPPRVELKVIDESRPVPAVDYFGPTGADEVLFDTPSAIARVIRSTANEKQMVVSAANTTDPNGRPLKFTWRVLRGNPDSITITPRNDAGSEVELQIGWHPPRPVPFNPELMTSRVDIAVFAHNGRQYSAPAFVSLTYPTHQRRRYDLDGHILDIDYDPAATRGGYVDPVLFPRREWQDHYRYTENGELIGWDRKVKNATERFTRHGARVAETDSSGRPIKAERVLYEFKQETPGERRVVAVPTGEYVFYRYRDPADVLGTAFNALGTEELLP